MYQVCVKNVRARTTGEIKIKGERNKVIAVKSIMVHFKLRRRKHQYSRPDSRIKNKFLCTKSVDIFVLLPRDASKYIIMVYTPSDAAATISLSQSNVMRELGCAEVASFVVSGKTKDQ